jgi:hypothetical protein
MGRGRDEERGSGGEGETRSGGEGETKELTGGDAAEDGEGEQAGGWAGVDGERAEREGAEPPTAGGTREVTEGAPAGKQREHDAAENGLVVNVGAAAEKKYGASETDMGCEQDRLPRGGARTLGAEQAGRVEE